MELSREEPHLQLGRVVGTVVASVKSPSLIGQRLLLVQPYTWERQATGTVFAAVDLANAGRGEWVYTVQGREAANSLPDGFNPSDRAILGIVDHIQLDDLPPQSAPGVEGG